MKELILVSRSGSFTKCIDIAF